MGKENISSIMDELAKYYNYKERTTLNRMRENPDPYKILISCLLSLRAKDETTERISADLFKIADTPEMMIKISDKNLEKIIFSTGHYRKKAKSLKHVSFELIDRFDSKVPSDKDDLLSIKGIGPKTANIVLNFAFDQEVLPIDTHCHRIPNRMGWVETKTAEKTEKELEIVLPKKYWKEFNAIFVLFGKEICQPVSPWCSKCVVRYLCPRIGVGNSR
jgi:endonuclease III